jgi:hypothetical protein
LVTLVPDQVTGRNGTRKLSWGRPRNPHAQVRMAEVGPEAVASRRPAGRLCIPKTRMPRDIDTCSRIAQTPHSSVCISSTHPGSSAFDDSNSTGPRGFREGLLLISARHAGRDPGAPASTRRLPADAARPRLRPADRILWAWLSRAGPGWREALVFVKHETVIAWKRSKGQRVYWAKRHALLLLPF